MEDNVQVKGIAIEGNPSDQARILIVEDESVVALDLGQRIRNCGHEVAGIAATGGEAIEMAKRTRPGLVLMDIRLPGAMDGVEAANQIRKQLDIPVIFATAYGDDATLGRAKVTGPFGYIIKPIEEWELCAAVEVALWRHRVESELKQRTRELTALNSLFQKHLSEWFTVVEAYRGLLDPLRSVCAELSEIKEKAESQPIPHILEISSYIQPDKA
ncbi:MAG: response regulator [Chloroflexi bacterium]|nr:response regulator [Chloroflexota bacterium]